MVVCGDFSKGLGKCVADKADEDVRKDREAVEKARQAKALLFANDSISSIDENEDKDTIVVDVVVNSEGERIILQLCEWHTIEAIKKRLIHSRRYCKERREELVSLVNNWVKSASEDLDKKEGCQFQCELLIRYGILCKHWLYQSFIEKTQVPMSLFHPRWLLDGPLVVRRGD
jgi:hypothetical protein